MWYRALTLTLALALALAIFSLFGEPHTEYYTDLLEKEEAKDPGFFDNA